MAEDRTSLTSAEAQPTWRHVGSPLYTIGSTTAGICGAGERQECLFYDGALVVTYQSKFLCYADGETYIIVPRNCVRSISVEAPGASWLAKLGLLLTLVALGGFAVGSSPANDGFYLTKMAGRGATLSVSGMLLLAGLYLLVRPLISKAHIVRIYHEDDKKNILAYEKKYILVHADEEPDRNFLLGYCGATALEEGCGRGVTATAVAGSESSKSSKLGTLPGVRRAAAAARHASEIGGRVQATAGLAGMELTDDWRRHKDANGGVYYRNSVTGDMSYSNPTSPAEDKQSTPPAAVPPRPPADASGNAPSTGWPGRVAAQNTHPMQAAFGPPAI